MRILKWLLGLIVAAALVLLAGGMLLSPTYTVTRSVEINAPADKVYALVASPKEWKRWSVWNLRDPAMQIDYSGPDSGTGATWAWKSKSEGNGKMIITAAEPRQRVAFDLLMEGFDRPGKGELQFAPAGAGTQVSWSMSGDMGGNPLFRWFALFADRMMGKDFEGGLANLKTQAETQ